MAVGDATLRRKLVTFKKNMTKEVLKADAQLQKELEDERVIRKSYLRERGLTQWVSRVFCVGTEGIVLPDRGWKTCQD